MWRPRNMSTINKKTALKWIFTISGIILFFGLGYLAGGLVRNLYENYQVKSSTNSTSTETSTSKEEATISQKGPDKILVEGELFDIPGFDANDAEKGEFSKKMTEKAVEAKSTKLNECQLNPSVIKIQSGSEFEIENIGESNHNIRLNEFQTVIKNKEKVKIELVGYEIGLYGIACDNTKMAGMVLIVD